MTTNDKPELSESDKWAHLSKINEETRKHSLGIQRPFGEVRPPIKLTPVVDPRGEIIVTGFIRRSHTEKGTPAA